MFSVELLRQLALCYILKFMNSNKPLALIGYASGIAAGDPGCGDGPPVLGKSSLSAELNQVGMMNVWEDMLYPAPEKAVLPAVLDLCSRLAAHTQRLVLQQQLFTVFGGDHSCAIGTWSGVFAAIQAKGPLGLIWIDAHMDAHTPASSETGNIHGMPLACLLGYGAADLVTVSSPQPKLRPEHVCIIGVRSYEAAEAKLIEKLGVRVYSMPEITSRGITAVLQEAQAIVSKGTAGYGLSIDLDGIDPSDAPAVGTPVPEGIDGQQLCQALAIMGEDAKLLGAEITEFNPHHDREQRTQQLISQLLISIFKH